VNFADVAVDFCLPRQQKGGVNKKITEGKILLIQKSLISEENVDQVKI
jgi:hypothetical protein